MNHKPELIRANLGGVQSIFAAWTVVAHRRPGPADRRDMQRGLAS